jgi:hypothetical protein
VKVADIPIADVDAGISLLCLAQNPAVRQRLLNTNNPPTLHDFMVYQQQINDAHPSAQIWRPASRANFQRALVLAMTYVKFTEQDRTMDKPTTYDCDIVRQTIEENGKYTLSRHSDAGINCVKTDRLEHTNGLSYSLKVYDKNIESLQVAEKVKNRSVGNKFNRCILPSTSGQRSRFSNRKFQIHGCGRIEGNFQGIGWTAQDMDGLINEFEALLVPAMRVCSFHDKVRLIERKIRSVRAVYFPQTFQCKKKSVDSTASMATSMDEVPETVVEYYQNSLTGQAIGRSIAASVDGRRTDDYGFEHTVQVLANEAPCNTPITIFILVHGFEQFMAGNLPVLALRVLEARKLSPQGQEVMNVMKGVQQPIDVMNSCGINTDLLQKLRFSTTISHKFQACGLDLEFVLNPTAASDFFVQPRPYQNYDTVPSSSCDVIIERLDESKEPTKLTFYLQSTRFAVPESMHQPLLDILETMPQEKKEWRGLTASYERDKFGLRFLFPDGMSICESACSILPVQSEPMEILKLCRKRHARGHTFEFILKDLGRFKVPITISKQFHTHLNQGDLDAITLIGRGYYMKHDIQECGYVKSGGKHPEELISIIQRSDGTEIIVAKSERTKKRRSQE